MADSAAAAAAVAAVKDRKLPVFSRIFFIPETYFCFPGIYCIEAFIADSNKVLEEQNLARRCSEGDREAEDELYRKYAAGLYALCLRYCSNADDAKDLMQESFITVLDKISAFRYRGNGSLYAWMSRIAVNKALKRIKREKGLFVSLELIPDQDGIPDLGREEMERIPQRKLLEMISRLPAVRRAVFNLYCLDGYSHAEIGRMLGISEKGSASALAKARKQLKAEIDLYLETQR